MTLDLRQLEIFEAIMRSGSVSAAAKELGITQSAVSRILARFEQSLGFDLFYRRGGRLSATSQANAVLSRARGILESVSALEAMSSIEELAHRQLKFVTVPSLAYGLMPSVIERFIKNRPGMRLGFDVRTTEAAVDVVVRRDASFAILALPVSHPTLHVTPLFRTVSCAVVRQDHHLAGRKVIRPKDLAGEKLIFLLRRQPTRQLIEDAFLRAGLSPDIQIETSNVATACRCVAEGLGIAVVNGIMAGYTASPEVAILPFEPRVHHTVALIEQAGCARSSDIGNFVDCLMADIISKSALRNLPVEVLEKGPQTR